MKRWKHRPYSLKNRIIKLSFASSVLTVALLLFAGSYLKNKLENEVARQYKGILDMQIRTLDDKLDQSASVLLTWNMNDAEVKRLKECAKRDEAERSIAHIKGLFSDAIHQGSMCELFFVLTDIDGRISGMAINGNFSAVDKRELEAYIRNMDYYSVERNKWQPVLVGDTWYIFYSTYEKGVCLGQAVRLDSVLESLEMRNDARILLTVRADDGTFLAGEEWIQDQKLTMQDDREGNYYFAERNCLIVKGISQRIDTPFYFIQNGLLSGDFNKIILVLNTVVICILAICVITVWRICVSLQRSLGILKETMMLVRDEGMEIQIEIDEDAPVEFVAIFYVFNDMMEKIRHFKIATYEAELEKKNYKIQYLSMQIEPHFYLNAMKSIYALAQKKEYVKIQKIILGLSDYYRYLTYDRSELVELKDELHHTESYLAVVRIGSGRKIKTVLEMENRAGSLRVPKLLLQTFIENALKYGVVEEHDLVINIVINVLEGEGEAYLSLVVKDNGKGFEREFLEMIESHGFLEQNGHVGLSGLWNRLRLIYGDKAYMKIKNLEEGGAYTEVMFPIKKDGAEKERRIQENECPDRR